VITDLTEELHQGAELLNELHDALTKYVVLPTPEAATAVVLWISATHGQTAWQHATRLTISSPEKRCGKSRLLDVIEATSHRPLLAVNATVAALYRSISAHDPPTLLFDEADAIWSARKSTDGAEDLRALINAGFGQGRPVWRCVGPQQTPTAFPSFAMAALAGIGDCLPDTVTDRAVQVTMRRRMAGETAQPWRRPRDSEPLHELRDRLGAWVREHLDELSDAEPASPLEDRAADTWEPLLALADLAGGDWPARARSAAVVMTAESDEGAVEGSLNLRLLADVRQVFQEAGVPDLSSEDLTARLRQLDESPWGAFELNQNALGRRLRTWAVKPGRIRVGEGGRQVRGYRLQDLLDPFTRYLPEPSDPPSQPVMASQAQVSPVTGQPTVTPKPVTVAETVTGATCGNDGVTGGDGGPTGHACPTCRAPVRPTRRAIEHAWPTYCRPCGEVAS